MIFFFFSYVKDLRMKPVVCAVHTICNYIGMNAVQRTDDYDNNITDNGEQQSRQLWHDVHNTSRRVRFHIARCNLDLKFVLHWHVSLVTHLQPT